jgi:hypothetical protein
VAPYHPIFMDGWSPDYPVVDELEANKHYNEGQYSSDYNDYDSSNHRDIFIYEKSTDSHHQKIEPERDLPPNLGESTRSDISVDSIERNGGEDRGVWPKSRGFPGRFASERGQHRSSDLSPHGQQRQGVDGRARGIFGGKLCKNVKTDCLKGL